MDQHPLDSFTPHHDRLLGIDSDGCVFDVMEIKHKECFCPAFIKHFALQPVAGAARAVWEFVNLYSATRGTNRFAAVPLALDLLADHPAVRARGFTVPAFSDLRTWLVRETRLGAPALEAATEATGSSELATVLAWHREVNERVADMVHGVPPFPQVKACLEAARPHCDIVVVSQASHDAIDREWREHGLMPLVDVACGQEMGTKREHLDRANDNRYADGAMLLLGDAPGDRDAALANGARFFPILPGDETASWQRFYDEGLPRFLDGSFDDTWQRALLAAFDRVLPVDPPW